MEEDSDVVKINGEGRAMINKVSRWEKLGRDIGIGWIAKGNGEILVGLNCEKLWKNDKF